MSLIPELKNRADLFASTGYDFNEYLKEKTKQESKEQHECKPSRATVEYFPNEYLPEHLRENPEERLSLDDILTGDSDDDLPF